jgi:hypothetical protein
VLDPRIFRMAFVPVALAVLVLAFSLNSQQGALGTTLAPDAFNPSNVTTKLGAIETRFPDRRPASANDQGLAGYVARTLTALHYQVSTDYYMAHTVDGSRVLENVAGVRTGFSPGAIVLLAGRDSLSSPDRAGLTATATLLEVARVLAERTLGRTIEIASVSGTAGGAGATRLASQLAAAGPVDAVIALGDLGGVRTTGTTVVPWGSSPELAPTSLRNTVASALGANGGPRPGASAILGQLTRLAFPLAPSAEGPFIKAGDPAVEISGSGEQPPPAGARVSDANLQAYGRATLQAVTALEQGRAIEPPAAYLIYDRKVIPAWSVRVLVLLLILPALAVTVDGFARARRRGYAVGRWLAWVLLSALPFAIIAGGAAALGMIGALPAPPGPVGAGEVPVRAGDIALIVVLVLLAGLAMWGRRALAGALAGARGNPAEGGAAVATTAVLCTCALGLWAINPFAAALVIPALNLWLWATEPDLGLRTPLAALLLLIGLAPPVLVAVYYASVFGMGPLSLTWTGIVMLAGGKLGMLTTALWCAVAGCSASALTIIVRLALRQKPEDLPVTVRGPVTYAGPGSLGGTPSAIRSRR